MLHLKSLANTVHPKASFIDAAGMLCVTAQ